MNAMKKRILLAESEKTILLKDLLLVLDDSTDVAVFHDNVSLSFEQTLICLEMYVKNVKIRSRVNGAVGINIFLMTKE